MYMRKPEIPVGKSNGLCNSVWEALKKHGVQFEAMQFFLVCSADSGSFSHEVIFYFICARDFHRGGLFKR